MTGTSVALGPPPPTSVRAAAWLLGLYGIAVLVHAVVLQSMNGWVDASDFPRGVLRTIGCLGLAWGLLSKLRWAWWLSALLVGMWVVLGTVSAVALLILARGSEEIAVDLGPFLLIAMVLLAVVEALLLLPSTREAFRKQRDPGSA